MPPFRPKGRGIDTLRSRHSLGNGTNKLLPLLSLRLGIKTIDSFILRFIKLQDIIGQKVFKSFLDEIGDYRDDMSFLDILDRLEKLGIIDSADQWMTYRKIGNELTHEYPDNLTEIADGIKLALAAFDRTTKVLQLLKERKALPGSHMEKYHPIKSTTTGETIS